ncbi:MAG: hypothetical protein ACXVQT_02350 [Actinomycetota bacterium]
MDGHPDGMSVERRPRRNPAIAGAGAGLLWGAFCYSVLWEGTPFGVDRPFVESVLGTLLLLPGRLVLWAIRAAELLAGRTFQLADSTWIFGVASCVAGLGLGVLIVLAVRGAAVLLRR